MPQPVDLTTVIEDAVSDSQTPAEVVDTTSDTSSEVSVEASPDASTASTEAPVSEDGSSDTSSEVSSPAARAAAAGAEDAPASDAGGVVMDNKLGIPTHVGGRENRIPYHRVKKIVEKAEKAASAPLAQKLAEMEPRIKDYESKLQNVEKFEQVMVNEPKQFLQMLAQIPAYQGFFAAIEQLQQRAVAGAPAQALQAPTDADPMPQPGPDGMYDMEGLDKLMKWQARQIETRVTKQVEQRYKPIEQSFEAARQREAQERHLNEHIIPSIQKKIEKAKTWPQFNENEPEIIKYLNANSEATLEDAYQAVVFPKLQADRSRIRQEVMEELRKAPTSSAAPIRPTRAAEPGPSKGPRDLEAIIQEQLKGLSGR